MPIHAGRDKLKVTENTPERLVLETFEGPQAVVAYALTGGGMVLCRLGVLTVHPVGIAGFLVAITGVLSGPPHARRLIFDLGLFMANQGRPFRVGRAINDWLDKNAA